MNRLEKRSYALYFDGKQLDPVSLEKNKVGLCDKCDSDLESLAYHRIDSDWLVSAQCKNEHFRLMRYDLEWNWRGDQELQISEEKGIISDIPREKLEAIFTPAEIRDMLACERGQSFTRQNLYRARAKYDRFEKLFGVKLDI
jgi:hypothetical protein